MYTTEEKVQMYNWYANGSSLRQVSALFAVEYPHRPVPSHGTVRNIVKKFLETGCLNNSHGKHTRQPTVLTEEVQVNVLASVELNSHISSRQLAREHGIDQKSVLTILKRHGYKSYKYQNHQELQPYDQEERIRFCERMLDVMNNDELLLRKILFTDESSFLKHGQAHNQNHRYWSLENQHRYNVTRTQYPESVNVWAGIIDNRIIGPFFINGTLNGQKYVNLLQENILPALENLNFHQPWFQQDGAPPHYFLPAREIINEYFPNRWIGRGGPIRWPARSPDLTPMDFFYWPKLKSRVYNHIPITTVDELKRRIVEASNEITPLEIQNSVNEFYNRVGYCLAENGNIFEQLL